MKIANLKYAIQFLRKYIRPYKKHFIAFYIGWLIETVISILIPKLIGIMLDQIVYQKDIIDFFKVSGVVVFLVIYSCVLYYWLYAQHHYLMIMFTFQIKIDVFEKFLKLRPTDLKKLKFGEMIAVIQDYPAECMHFLIRGIIHQINNFIIVVFLIVFSFKINYIMGIMMTFFSLICGGVTIFSGNKNKKASIIQRKEYGTYVSWLYDMIENYVSIWLLSMQKRVKQNYQKHSQELFSQKDRMVLLQGVSEQFIKGLLLMAQICIFAVSIYLTNEKLLSIGSFTVLMTYFSRLTSTIIDINFKWNDAQTRVGFIQKIQEFLALPDEKGGEITQTEYGKGEIDIENVMFRYDSKVIYNNFSLHIDAGEKIAIVGESGCGKSTLAELISGLINVSGGIIRIDGIRITDYSLKLLRKKIGIMFQDITILEESIKENLLLANRNASDNQIWKVICDVGLDDFVNQLPEGIDTPVRDTMSGGQKQKLALAQLLLRNPEIIILDEPTSALDNISEKEILLKLGEIFESKTVIIITHRSQPKKICNRVIRIGEEYEINNKV